MPKASVAVIVPNYRRVTELTAALGSIRAQTYQGPVRTYLVYQERPEIQPLLDSLNDQIVPIPFEPDGSLASIAAQRNVGIRASDEDFIAFLDDDDLWHPEKLSRQIDVMKEASSPVASCTGWLRFLSPRSPAWVDLGDQPSIALSRYQIVRSGLLMTSTLVVDGPTMRKLMLDDRPEWLGLDDYHLKLRLSDIGNFRMLPDPLAALRMDPTGASRERPTLQYARALDVLVEWMLQGNRRPVDWAGLAIRAAVTAVFPEGEKDESVAAASAMVGRTLDGRLLGPVDRWLAAAIRAGWRSTKLVPWLRPLVTRRVVR